MKHSTALNTRCVMADTTPFLIVMMLVRWYDVTLNYPKHSLAQSLSQRTVYRGLAALPQRRQDLWFWMHLVYAHRWSGVKIKTYFSTFWGLSFIMMATLMSDPSCLLSLPVASILRTISSIAYLMMITSSPWMRPCQH